jgi:RNA polymerase sigma-70 factor (ECF subfamily)
MQEDMELWLTFKSGDVKGFELLVMKYKVTVFNTVHSIVGDRGMADDITQEVFLKIYNSVNDFKEKSSFSTWVYRITVNTALNELRKKKKNTVSLETEINNDEKLQLKDVLRSDENLDKYLEDKHVSETVQKMLNALPEKYRMVVVLKEVDGLAYNEISEVLGISLAQVKIWLFRARQFLKSKLEAVYEL